MSDTDANACGIKRIVSSGRTLLSGVIGRITRSRGPWALADQAVLSLGNFLTSLLLIRHWHGATDHFGQYALFLSVILFLNGIHSALVVYPLTVLGAASGRCHLGKLSGEALGLTLGLLPVTAFALGVAAMLSGTLELLPWAAGAMFLWQTQETLRRALLARLRHRDALCGDIVSYLGQAGLIWVLARRMPAGHAMPVSVALFAIGVTSAAGAVIQAIQIRTRAVNFESLFEFTRQGWRLGRWLLLAAVVTAATVYVGPWTLQAARGAAEVARFSALATLVNLTNPVTFSIAGLVVPAVAASGAAGARGVTRRYAIQGAVLLVPYLAALVIAPVTILRAFYGANSPYLELATPLRLFALAWGMGFVVQVCFAALNGLQKPRGTFIATAIGAVGNLLLTVPFAMRFGLSGAAWAGMVPLVVQLAVCLLLFRRATAETAGPTQPMPAAPGERARELDPRFIEVAAA